MIEPLFCEQTDILLRQNLSARAWKTGYTDKKSTPGRGYTDKKSTPGHAGTWILAQ
ncbi:hypothetical protein LTSEINV_2118 [Salmonella enterica subsp. enterica serovar Inverness str. R8-3668]|uniref:Uncharacterized protein n=1 Tax=Salmonella enterica subsp. enterica serovar Inverness str. R8-3668 TaxID=913075 RepID=G5NC38_SALET|nr:hypothetical protein LTSEINV_2118 [Salmonella enterica subsp. enterica serovar Inverness str. R8-3668]